MTEIAPVASVRRSDRRRAYRRRFRILLSLCVAGAIGGLFFLIYPNPVHQSAIGDALPFVLERLWALTYLVGAGLVLYAMWQLDLRYQVAGLLLLSGCYSTYLFALLTQRTLAAVVISAPVFGGLAVGCFLRAYELSHDVKGKPWRQRRS